MANLNNATRITYKEKPSGGTLQKCSRKIKNSVDYSSNHCDHMWLRNIIRNLTIAVYSIDECLRIEFHDQFIFYSCFKYTHS